MKYIVIFVTGVAVGVVGLLGAVWLSEEDKAHSW